MEWVSDDSEKESESANDDDEEEQKHTPRLLGQCSMSHNIISYGCAVESFCRYQRKYGTKKESQLGIWPKHKGTVS